MSKMRDGIEMTNWKHGFYANDGYDIIYCDDAEAALGGDDERESWGLFLPLGERDGAIDLHPPTIDPAAFWATLLERAPEVAKALADAAPRAGVTAVYPHKVFTGGNYIHDRNSPIFDLFDLRNWEPQFRAQLDKTKVYHMHITLVEAVP